MKIGVDIVDVRKIEKVVSLWGERFLTRVYSKQELEIAKKKVNKIRYFHYLAGRFAVKEAIIKTLDVPVALNNISVVNADNGMPVVLYPEGNFEVSISHTSDYAVAVCMRY